MYQQIFSPFFRKHDKVQIFWNGCTNLKKNLPPILKILIKVRGTVTEEGLIKITFSFKNLKQFRVAQRITRSATNREFAGSNPVPDKSIFFFLHMLMQSLEVQVNNFEIDMKFFFTSAITYMIFSICQQIYQNLPTLFNSWPDKTIHLSKRFSNRSQKE